MRLDFHPVSLEEADRFYELWDATPQRSIDYSLVNLWGWQPQYGLQWAFAEGLCWIRQTSPCLPVLWAPVGDWKGADWDRLLEPGMDLIRVPERLEALWSGLLPGRVRSESARGQWEYLYDRKDLAELPGNRYHKKKNHLSAFVKANGEPDYRPFDERVLEDCLALQDTWCQWHDCEHSPSLLSENDAINRVLSRLQAFRGLKGGALYVKDEIVAFTLGERLDERTMGVHYEKGLNSVRGVYQTINAVFCRRDCAEVALVNRAQDLDEAGLRQAKESYLPSSFLMKHSVSIS